MVRNGRQKNDPRVTRVGKFIRKTRIDELPQLINILRGDMSLIGPRPERPVFTEKFDKEIPGFKKALVGETRFDWVGSGKRRI